MSKYLHDGGKAEKAEQFCQLLQLDLWIKRVKLSNQEKSILYLYRIVFNTLKPAHSDDDYADTFASWILWKLHPPLNSKWRSPFIEYLSTTALMNLTCHLWTRLQEPQFCNQLGTAIFRLLNIEKTVDTQTISGDKSEFNQWKIDDSLRLPYISRGDWKINLTMGQLYHTEGQIKGVDEKFPWEATEPFERLFPNETGFDYREIGQQRVHFTHPNKGYFRITPKSQPVYLKQAYYFESQIIPGTDRWLQYRSPEELLEGVPKPLACDFSYWSPDEKAIDIKGFAIQGFFCRLSSHQIAYVMLDNGLILEADPATGAPMPDGLRLDYLDTKKQGDRAPLEGLLRFDLPNNIVTYRDLHERLITLVFKRYRSIDGNPLVFFEHGDHYLFSENREYKIPSCMPKVLLGTIENYLFLTHVKDPKPNSGLLILPFRRIVAQNKTIIADGELEIDNPFIIKKARKGEKAQNRAQLITGSELYFLYQVEDGRVVPKSVESKLYLAYVYLSQKKAEEAVRLLSSVKPIDMISKTSIAVLGNIIDLKIHHDHPDFKIVRLYAFKLMVRQKQQESNEPVEEYFDKDDDEAIERLRLLIQDLPCLLQGANNLSITCRMETAEELSLLNLIISEGLEKSKENKIVGFLGILYDCTERLKGNSHQQQQAWVSTSRYPRTEHLRPLAPKVELVDPTILDPASIENSKIAAYTLKLDEILGWIEKGLDKFIPKATHTYPITRVPEDITLERNGKLFLEVLETARSNNKDQILEMLFRLKMWRDNFFFRDTPHLDCMIMILVQADVYQPMIDDVLFERPHELNQKYRKYLSLKAIQDCYTSSSKPCPSKIPPFDANHYRYRNINRSSHYPASSDLFHAKEYKPSDVSPEPVPIKVTFQDLSERWQQFDELKEQLVPDREWEKKAKTEYEDFSFVLPDKLLAEDQKIYKKSLEAYLESLQKEYEEGKKTNNADQVKTLPKEKTASLLASIQKAHDEVAKARQATQNLLLCKANQRSDDELQRLSEFARIGGKAEKLMTLHDCVECLLSFDSRFYISRNPNLLAPERIQEVADLTLRWLDLKSHEAQLAKARDIVREIQSLDSDIEGHPGSQKADAPRRSLCVNLESILDGRYHFAKSGFDDPTHVAFRVFCGQKGDIPFEIQVDLIKKMLEVEESDCSKFKEIVIQLIMGGGKTAILGTIILYLATCRTVDGKKRIGFFIVPPSLFKTFSMNFSEAMLQSFGKEVIALDLSREDYTLHRLKETEMLLAQAANKQMPIILSAFTLQGMELEELSLARRIHSHILTNEKVGKQMEASRSQSAQLQEALKARSQGIANNILELGAKAKLIARQLTFTSENADSLLDEADQILDCNMELTYVDGSRIPVDAPSNHLMLTIYKTLISDKIRVDTLDKNPTMRDLVRLTTNNQSLLSETTYQEYVVPIIAREVIRNVKAISSQIPSSEEAKKAFVRYASGKIPPCLQKLADSNQAIGDEQIRTNSNLKDYPIAQALDDITFLRHLKKLSQGTENQREAADLIAQTKQFLTELVKTTLGKMGGRNYGQSLIAELQHKIIPYRGVNAPAPKNNEFGNEWVTAASHYQFGAAYKPSRDQIYETANQYLTSAHYYVDRNREKLDETAEWYEFKSLFGITLNELDQMGKIEEAIATISKDPEKLLEWHFPKVFLDATYASERLTNDGFALMDLCHSTRTMTATPWNLPGYDRREPRVGGEGRILHMAAKRSSSSKIIEIDFTGSENKEPMTMRCFLEEIYNKHPQFFSLRCFADSDALFKGFGSNSDVAKAWMHFIQAKQNEEKDLHDNLKKVDPNIDAVLFFHIDGRKMDNENCKGEKDEKMPNTLYAFRKGSAEPVRIGSSTVSNLKSFGLSRENFVIYIDELHCKGTDVKLLSNALGLKTYDKKGLLCTDTQTRLRCRDYLYEQDVFLVVNKEARRSIFNQGKTEYDIILQEAADQAVRGAQATVRYFVKQVNHIFRRQAVKAIREANLRGEFDENYARLVDRMQRFFTHYYKPEPFKQYGRLKTLKDPKISLKKMLSKQLEEFKSCTNDSKILKAVEDDSKRLVERIDACKYLPRLSKDISRNFDFQHVVEQLVDRESVVDMLVEIEQEVELELTQYEYPVDPEIHPEKPMTQEAFQALLCNMRQNPAEANNITSLKKQLGLYHCDVDDKIGCYADAFDAPIYGTDVYFHTAGTKMLLPVFHSLQRPPKQILVLLGEDRQLRFLILSQLQANDVQQHLTTLYQKDPEAARGAWLIQPDGTLLAKGKRMDEFPNDDEKIAKGLLEINAFAGHIDYLDDEVNRDLTEKWLSNRTELKIKFLKLKCCRNEKQRLLLCSSSVISQAVGRYSKNVQNSGYFVCKLRQEWEKSREGNYKLDETWKTKVLDQGKNIENLNSNFVKHLGLDPTKEDEDADTHRAVKHLKEKEGVTDATLPTRAKELSEIQFKNIRAFHCSHLTPEQIHWLPVQKVRFLTKPDQIMCLSLEQAVGLKEQQANLIPFVNPEFYYHFDQPWQISAIPADLLPRMNPNFGYHLTESQAKSIKRENLRSDAANHQADFFVKLFKTFSGKQIGSLHGDLLDLVPALERIHIKKEQVREITSPQLIRELEKLAAEGNVKRGLWSSWVAPGMVKHLHKDQIPYLETKEQIAEVAENCVDRLLPASQVPLIKSGQVNHLIGEAQIQACPLQLVNHLHEDQLFAITNMQVSGLSSDQLHKLHAKHHPRCKEFFEHITVDQLKNIDNEAFLALVPLRLIAHISVHQIQHLKTPQQIQACPAAFADHISDVLTPHIRPEHVPYISRPSQIQAILCRTEFIEKLEKKHLRYLTPDQTKLLTRYQIQLMEDPEEIALLAEDQIQHIHAEQVQHLTEKQINACPVNLAGFLSPEQMPHIRPEHVPYITRSNLIQAIPCRSDLIEKLDMKYLCHLTQDQVKFLTPSQIQKMTASEEIALLDENQIKHILPYQVKYLTANQIKACPVNLAEFLTPEQIPHIRLEHVAHISSFSQIKAIPCSSEFIAQLEKKHLRHLTPEQARLLTPAQIQLMNKRKEITNLDERGIKMLALSQVRLIESPSQIPYLGDNQVPALPDQAGLVQWLVKRQFQFITEAQAHLLTLVQIRSMNCPAEIALLKPHQIAHLKSDQVKFLERRDHVQALPATAPLVSELAKKHLRDLTHAQAKLLTPSQIQWINEREEIALLEQEQIQHILPAQVPLLNERQIKDCPLNLTEHLTVEQTAHIRPEHVTFISRPSQIQAIPCSREFMARLEEKHLRYLTPVQASLLTPVQIQLMKNREEIVNLDKRGIRQLLPVQIPLVQSASQISNLGNNQVRDLPAEAWRVHLLVKQQFRFITEAQVCLLKPEQVKQMNCREEIALLGPREIAFLEPEQVQFLEGQDQVQALPATAPLTAMLRKRHLRLASPAQVRLLKPEQVKQMNCGEEIALLGPREIAFLEPEQVQFLEGQDQVQALPA
ncbi:MAG: hypothetical protein LLG04_17210, partial [Parachlamydia sp.]|nr:hypothetical protein [Parachlamydia sp.]